MTFTIRAASIADVPAMHRLRMAVQENRLSDPQHVTEKSYRRYIAENSVWVAEADGEIDGFAAIDAPTAQVWALFVDPSAEGAGIGRALHQRMLEWAREQNVGQLSLTTSRGTRAERFYFAAGWRDAGLTADGEVRLEIMLSA